MCTGLAFESTGSTSQLSDPTTYLLLCFFFIIRSVNLFDRVRLSINETAILRLDQRLLFRPVYLAPEKPR